MQQRELLSLTRQRIATLLDEAVDVVSDGPREVRDAEAFPLRSRQRLECRVRLVRGGARGGGRVGVRARARVSASKSAAVVLPRCSNVDVLPACLSRTVLGRAATVRVVQQ